MSNSLLSELKKLQELCQLGDPTSQAKLKLLFDLHKATLETQAWSVWLERIYPYTEWPSLYKIGENKGEFRIIPLKTEDQCLELIVVENQEETYLRLEFSEAPAIPSPIVFLTSEHWDGLDPSSAYYFLGSISELEAMPSFFITENLILQGTKIMAGSLRGKLGGVLRTSATWSLPGLRCREFRIHLNSFQESFSGWLRLCELSEKREPVLEVCNQLYEKTVEVGKVLSKALNEEFSPIELIPQDLRESWRGAQKEYKFKLSPITREAQYSLKLHPLISLICETKESAEGPNHLVTIRSPNSSLVRDLISSLHSSYIIESLS